MTYDGPKEAWASLALPAYGLTAEFRVTAIEDLDEQDEEVMSWIHVGTDQLRFIDGHGDVVALAAVAPVAYSEVVRSLERIIDQCSVGNDPEWCDSGAHLTHREYWERVALGKLSAVAHARRLALAGIVDRMKIAEQLRLDDTYLHVAGSIGEYTIHLGSLMVFMAPDDRPLTLMARSKKPEATVPYLPFEGDEAISLIISMAILLAGDDKIKDKKLLNEIRGASQ
jgi:hypothetical protein